MVIRSFQSCGMCCVQCSFLFLQKMADFKEQCICIRLFQIGIIDAETFQTLTFAFREEAMRQNVQKCGTYLRDLA